MIGGRAFRKVYGTAQNIDKFQWRLPCFYSVKQKTSRACHKAAARAIPNPEYSASPSENFCSGDANRNNAVTRDCCSSTRDHNVYDYNVQMRDLGRRGNVKAARLLFDEMRQRDPVSYASMVSIYLKHKELHKAEELFHNIPEGMRGIVVDSAMVHAYAKAGSMERAREVFDGMPERNAFSWTSMISGYFRLGRVDDAVELLRRMPVTDKNEITWTNVIMGFGRNGLIDEARDAFDQMHTKTVVAWTSMIKGYVENHQVDAALKLFHTMPQRNLYSWNIVIYGLLGESRVNEAKELFDSMPWRNAISWTTMVMGLAQNRMTELARSYFDQMPNKDISAWNAMITAYADEGRMVEAVQLFKLMPKRNIVTWNAMIDGYAKDRQDDEAFRHFVLMLRDCTRPNETSLTSLLTSCRGILGVLQVHGLIVHLGVEAETLLTNTLMAMYYKNGDVISARIAFDNLEVKDIVSWTTIILAYSNHGFGIQALQAFSRMLRSGYKPDDVTFIGVLSACSHAGLVKKGQMLFDSIKSAYGLEPLPEHYSCLVDMLGRAGMVKEAMKVLTDMPPDKYDTALLGALLGACRLHGDERLAEYIANELIELEPESSGGYVLLANVYAASGKWDQFSQLRKKMKERKVKKLPGFSQIEVNGKSHAFLVCDRFHPEMKEIYALLHERLLPLMEDSDCEIETGNLILMV